MLAFDFETDALTRRLVELEHQLRVMPGELDAAAAELVNKMVVRTRSGRRIDGRFFSPHATLSDTGAMLDGVLHRLNGDHAVVYFSDPQLGQRAMWLHHGTKHMPPRPWFGFSQRDLEAAGHMLAERISTRLEALL